METFITYLFQSFISLLLLYLIYYFFLKKDTFFSLNRYYLLGSLFFSLLIPVFDFSFLSSTTEGNFRILLDEVMITQNKVGYAIQNNLNTFQVLLVIYLTGSSIFLLRFLSQVIRLMLITRKYGISREHGLRLVFMDRQQVSFSFFNLIFLNKQMIQNKDIDKILAHEQIHVEQGHSIDLIIVEILSVLQWFNPVVWLYKHSLKEIHEYIADNGVLQSGADRVNYQRIMLSLAMGAKVSDLTHNFNYSLTKRRFDMITKARSAKGSVLKMLIALPVLGLIIFYSCQKTNSQEEAELRQQYEKQLQEQLSKDVRENALYPSEGTEKELQLQKEVAQWDEVDIRPEFPGGKQALFKFIIDNVKYPKEAIKENITGKVFINFIIDKNGDVREVSLKQGVHELLDNEALRVVSLLPAWTPGEKDGKKVNVAFSIPINFNLE